MVKSFFAFMLFLSFSNATQNISRLNSVANTPGFSINEQGSVVTDWKLEQGTSFIPGKKIKIYSSATKNSVTFLETPGASFPSGISINSQKLIVHAKVDASGAVESIVKCDPRICAGASKKYCSRIYKDFKVKTSRQLIEKIAECASLEKLNPTTDEHKEISDVMYEYKKIFIPAYDDVLFAPVRAVWDEFDKRSAISWNSYVKQRGTFSIKTSSPAKYNLIGELCDVVLPESERVETNSATVTPVK